MWDSSGTGAMLTRAAASQEPPSQCSHCTPSPFASIPQVRTVRVDGAGGTILRGHPSAGSYQELMQIPPPSPAGIVPIHPSLRGCSWEGENIPLGVGIFRKEEEKKGLRRTIGLKLLEADESAVIVLELE